MPQVLCIVKIGGIIIMKNNKTRSTRVGNNEEKSAAGPRRPVRKPPARPGAPSSPAKPAGNKPAQPSPPPKKPTGK